ncbi:hypothetical protein [Enterococcus avium]|uniref:hypothetical protein n=1 Tax=Enterococcus avium TaxID=33945 RepID=UPI001F56F84A|nr:hypothetical protein [Enterococcus avium]
MTALELYEILKKISIDDLKRLTLYIGEEGMIIEHVSIENDCLDFQYYNPNQ